MLKWLTKIANIKLASLGHVLHMRLRLLWRCGVFSHFAIFRFKQMKLVQSWQVGRCMMDLMIYGIFTSHSYKTVMGRERVVGLCEHCTMHETLFFLHQPDEFYR